MSVRPFLLAVVLLAGASAATAQERLPQPWSSPRATVSQRVGMTDVEVVYFRPGVKERQIWGGLVPYDRVWRCGANENTVVSFAHDVMIEGEVLAAGDYGLHMIPRADRWTVIFSTNTTSWGSYFYDETEDALRVDVTPSKAPTMEWLQFEFGELTTESATLSLRWSDVRVPVRITTDTHAIVLEGARTSYLRNLPAFSWQGWNNAADYCLRNDVNLEEGLTWAENSVRRVANFTNVSTKAGLLEKLGRAEEAAAAREQALNVTTEAELNSLGFRHLQQDDTERAVALFERNTLNHPSSWSAFDSLGHAYAKVGRTDDAIVAYTRALELVGAAGNAEEGERIRSILNGLGG